MTARLGNTPALTPLTVAGGRCTRRFSGCAVCVNACPQSALTVSPGPSARPRRLAVNTQACTSCGLCAVACPADAISGVGTSPATVVADAAAAEELLVIRCRRATGSGQVGPRAPVVPVNCLVALDPETLAAAAATLRRGQIRLERAACEGCPVAPAGRVAGVVAHAARLVDAVAPSVTLTEAVLPAEPRDAGPAPSVRRPFSRRTLFGLPATGPVSAKATARELLVAAAPSAPMPGLRASEACTACQACARVCPTGALAWSSGETEASLRFDATRCVGCEECARICPEDAIGLLDDEPGPHRPTVLISVRHRRCTRCARGLGPGEADLCAQCTGRRQALDDVWRHLNVPAP